MARKSRKNQEQAAVTVMQEPTIRAALYIRLSVEDTRTNSISIETQELLCKGWSHHLIHMTAVHLWQNGTLQL